MSAANALTIEEIEIVTPKDLMSLNELALKYGCSYDYWYKWSVREKVIPAYYNAVWKLSERDVQEFIAHKTEKKLHEVKSCKGGE